MRSQDKLVVVFVAAIAAAAGQPVRSQEGEGAGTARTPSRLRRLGNFWRRRTRSSRLRVGALFDARLGRMLANQVIVVRGERIAEVGSGVQVPRRRDRARSRRGDRCFPRHDRRATST